MNWFITQLGARQHYAVPRAFHQVDRLNRFYTDLWASNRLFRTLPFRCTMNIRGRWHSGLADAKVTSRNIHSLAQFLNAKTKRTETRFERYLRFGESFGNWTAHQLCKQNADINNSALFSFNTAALEALRSCAERGMVTLVDQIDAAEFEEHIVQEEADRWPGWQSMEGNAPQDYWDRLREEWDVAKYVLVNSDWTRRALIRQGVVENKLIVVPHAYEPKSSDIPLPTRKMEKWTVLWLGQVNLRKGIQYLIQAAKILASTDIEFVIVGPIFIDESVIASTPKNMRFVGPVPRDQATSWYDIANVFVLPTLSDGFAITQLEAMDRGVPVIATDRCGDVVVDQLNGLRIPIREPEILAEAIRRLRLDDELSESMGREAKRTAGQYTLERYANTVEAAVTSCQK